MSLYVVEFHTKLVTIKAWNSNFGILKLLIYYSSLFLWFLNANYDYGFNFDIMSLGSVKLDTDRK